MTYKLFCDIFGNEFTDGDDTYSSWLYVGRYNGKAGNDIFSTADNGGILACARINGNDGDDRLKLQGTTTLIGKNVYDGGNGIDTFYVASSNTAINMINDTTVSFGNTHCCCSGTLQLVNVERYVIEGSDYADVLRGSAGGDWLDGNGGLDKFFGSAGDDGYVFDNSAERVVGEVAGGGNDSIWTFVSVDLRDNPFVENLRLQGTDAIDGIGTDGANLITGNAASNVITGGAGADKLYGNGGADIFVFAEFGSANADHIWDFGTDDKIKLDSSVFTGLHGTGGVLDASDFAIGAANSTDAQIIYNKGTGYVSYDADGTGSGATQDIAFIGRNLAIDSSHILLA